VQRLTVRRLGDLLAAAEAAGDDQRVLGGGAHGRQEQMVFLGNPEYGVNLAPLDFVKFAEACGARGMHIEDPTTCGQRMREALQWDGPAIIEVLVDPHEPPMPASVKQKDVKNMAQALRKGTPNRKRIALTIVRNLLDESSFDASPGGFLPDSAEKVAEIVRPA
jgi:pyruvate dehydrogenase (quinone)/pyruvate oxidase